MTAPGPQDRLRVAIVSDWYLPRFGGIETQVHGLARALIASGMEVTVFTPVPGPRELDGVRIDRLAPESGYRFPPSLVASNFRDFLYVLELLARRGADGPLARLKHALAAGGFDVVHAQLGNTPFSYMAVNAARALNMPVVATFHSMLSGGEIPFAALGCLQLGCGRWRGNTLVTAVSSKVAAVRQPMVGSKIAVLPNGIDAGFWSGARKRRATKDPDAPVELIAAMRLHARKRPMALLDAIQVLAGRNLPGRPGYRLSIAGDGPMRDRLQAAIGDRGLETHVRLVGKHDRKGLAELFATGDLFLMPSFFESFGIAALEARMAGLPVLTMASSGAWDFLTPGVDALSARDDTAFADELMRFIGDPGLRQALASGAAQPLHAFDWPQVSARAIDCYRAAMNRASGVEPA